MISPAMRILVLVTAATVAACTQTTSQAINDSPGAPAPAHMAAAGRNIFSTQPAAPPTPAYTVEQARQECWMQSERDKKLARDLDKRARMVEACVAEKMNAHASETR